MGIIDRYKKQQRSEINAGKPLGGGLDEKVAPALPGKAFVGDLRVEKPAEKGGKKGLKVLFKLEVANLSKFKLVVETTLHDQELGQFKSRMATFADTQGLLNVWEVLKPAKDEPTTCEREVFVPFEAIDVQREGKVWCFARVRVLEPDHGAIAEAEAAFAIDAG
ncbi:MAG TPA: hypothetical protein VGK67_11190 [Myxococcales bacterium]|jgi:hypothetical protein